MSIDKKIDEPENKEVQQSKREKREARRKERVEFLESEVRAHYDQIAVLEKEIFMYVDPWGYYRKFHKGTPRKKLSRVCPQLYVIFKDRDQLKNISPKRRFFKDNSEVMDYYSNAFPGYASGEVWKLDPVFHEIMRRRGLLAKIPPYAPWPPSEPEQVTETPKQEY